MHTKFRRSDKFSRLSDEKIAKFHAHFPRLFESLYSFVFTKRCAKIESIRAISYFFFITQFTTVWEAFSVSFFT